MPSIHRLFLPAAILVVTTASAAFAGGPPVFKVGLTVQAHTSDEFKSDFGSTAADAPVTAQVTSATTDARASARFTELKTFSESTVDDKFVTSFAAAHDTVTIMVPNEIVGTTRLEMTWQLDGLIMGDAILRFFNSQFRTDDTAVPDTSAGGVAVITPGVVDQLVTFVYDNVPIGAPWNLDTRMRASTRVIGSGCTVICPGIGKADFANSATLTDVSFFVDDSPVSALITGQSGFVYAVPEPGTMGLVLIGALGMVRRRGAGASR